MNKKHICKDCTSSVQDIKIEKAIRDTKDKFNCIEEISINDAWREAMRLCIKNGKDFVVKGGSYMGQIRKQLSDVKIRITQPWTRPLAPIVCPPYQPPTNDEKIETYFEKYIMGAIVQKNEDYTYGSYIVPQVQPIVEILRKAKGHTNQAAIAIGGVESVSQNDPPCLRSILFKVVDNRLQMSVLFRSWDLYTGFPENLGGLQMLKEYILVQIEDELGIQDGPIVAYSDGLHLYDQYFDLANDLNIEKIKVSKKALEDKEAFNRELDAIENE